MDVQVDEAVLAARRAHAHLPVRRHDRPGRGGCLPGGARPGEVGRSRSSLAVAADGSEPTGRGTARRLPTHPLFTRDTPSVRLKHHGRRPRSHAQRRAGSGTGEGRELGVDVVVERRLRRRPTFSSRWASEPVPGIGSMTGERRSSHASASWAGVWPVRAASASSGPPGRASGPAAIGNHGMNAMPSASEWSSSASDCRFAEVVEVLDADDRGDRAGRLELLDAHLGEPEVADLALVLEGLELTRPGPRAGRPGRCGAAGRGRSARRRGGAGDISTHCRR